MRARLALLGGLLLVLAVALAVYLLQRPSDQAERGPIVIGLLHALSGPMAASEAPLVATVKLAVEEINAAGGLLGRRVELKIEDTRSEPRVAAAAAERLISSERAVALFGCWSSNCRQAVRPVVETHRHLLFYPLAYEGLEQSAHIIYTGPTPNQHALPAADWAMHGFGRRVYLVGTDALYARRVNAMLRDFILLSGGKVLGERYVPLGGADMGGVLADLQNLQPDLVLSTLGGSSNRAFFDALVAASLTDLPLLSLRAAEPEMAAYDGGRLDRHFTAWSYLQSQPGPANQAFLARLRRSQGEGIQASDPAVSAYVGVQLWAAAVREVGSPRTDVVNANVLQQSVALPQGFGSVDSQSRHLWRQLRIAQVKPGGQLSEVFALPRYIKPEPWPVFRSAEHWMAVLPRSEGTP
ncbi:urea transport system substrate-binding protein [Pelomonas saccharophila]|uniref:Urea transport system substrate-binding protein n=1 Tax=Roseateles saccharophilus TaxID=304 RepID=A0ABU1YFR1_ROSSA|nr:urea ABC transporter substrate-binding protein [Roseateles saccharophilus]MDR7267583.1 urea transport system substrate-binding protein [Roseateles saccharophilus]